MASAFSTSDSIEQNIAAPKPNGASSDDTIVLGDIWDSQQKEECVAWIESTGRLRVALQFPDELVRFSGQITNELEDATPENVHIFVLGDTSYGSCCVDEVAASHVNADGIVHFGNACLSKTARTSTYYVAYKFKLDQTHFFDALAQEFPDRNTRLQFYYDVGYQHALTKLKGELLQRFPEATMATLATPDMNPNVLRWKYDSEPNDCSDSISSSPAIYVGKDHLDFYNLTMSMYRTQWWLYDPSAQNPTLNRKMNNGGPKWHRRTHYVTERCKDAKSIGIVVATLYTAGYLDIVKRIQQLAKARGVRTYIISIGKVNPEKLANFTDIDCFVLVGCPYDDTFLSRDFYRPVLSCFEAECALNPDPERKLYLDWSTDFTDLLPEGRLYWDIEQHHDEFSDTPDVSLITMQPRSVARNTQEKSDTSTDTMEMVAKGNNQLAHITSADNFANRSWQGLEQNLGNDDPALVEDGRSGIPIRYENDPREV